MKQKSLTPAQRLRRMHNTLIKTYGPQLWWPAKTAFEVILGAYLTQNTAWKAVERSLANLESAKALTLSGIRSLTTEDLQSLIRPSGFAARKAPAIKAFVAMVDAEFSGSLDTMGQTPASELRSRLLSMHGVGPETADAILLYAFGKPVPVADEYLRRIAERHRLIEPAPGRNRKGYDSLVSLTHEAFAAEPSADRAQLFNEFHALVVAVGKAHCGRTANCTHCPLNRDLPANRRDAASRKS